MNADEIRHKKGSETREQWADRITKRMYQGFVREMIAENHELAPYLKAWLEKQEAVE